MAQAGGRGAGEATAPLSGKNSAWSGNKQRSEYLDFREITSKLQANMREILIKSMQKKT